MTSLCTIPSPLTCLAIHIPSFHANSASCEQLFSLFGNIQTRKRNCMTSQTLQTIAEVRMHIYDSHAAFWNLKQQFCKKQQLNHLQMTTIKSCHSTQPQTSLHHLCCHHPLQGETLRQEVSSIQLVLGR